jgi:ribosome assembly protein YihI (activator of Der GTPase)
MSMASGASLPHVAPLWYPRPVNPGGATQFVENEALGGRYAAFFQGCPAAKSRNRSLIRKGTQAMPQISDAQLAEYQNVDTFVRRALGSPKHRRRVLEIQKDFHPETAIPEIDESNPLQAKLQALEERLDERDNTEQTRALSQNWNAGRERARKRGFADEGLAKLENFMEQRGILSHDDAVVLFEHDHPPPIQARSSGAWDFFGAQPQNSGPDLKLLFEGQDEAWLAQAIPDTLNRVRNGG